MLLLYRRWCHWTLPISLSFTSGTNISNELTFVHLSIFKDLSIAEGLLTENYFYFIQRTNIFNLQFYSLYYHSYTNSDMSKFWDILILVLNENYFDIESNHFDKLLTTRFACKNRNLINCSIVIDYDDVENVVMCYNNYCKQNEWKFQYSDKKVRKIVTILYL